MYLVIDHEKHLRCFINKPTQKPVYKIKTYENIIDYHGRDFSRPIYSDEIDHYIWVDNRFDDSVDVANESNYRGYYVSQYSFSKDIRKHISETEPMQI